MDSFYLLRYYDKCGGKIYKSKAAAMKVVLKSYLDNIDGWNLDVEDIKNDLRTFIESDWIENYCEIDKVEVVEGEE